MLELLALIGFLAGANDEPADDVLPAIAVPTLEQKVDEDKVADDVVPAASVQNTTPTLPDPFPEFSAALTDCLAYFDGGDLTVFEDGTEIIDGVGAKSVFYPTQSNPPAFQIVVTQRAGLLNCGGTGAAAPRAIDLDTRYLLTLDEILTTNALVEVKFPAPTRLWANCDTGGDTFVMMVPGAGDLVVLSASGNEPTAGVYCQAFGVKE